jgi:dCMP deaminase
MDAPFGDLVLPSEVRAKQLSWDKRWMGLALHYASFSKDRSRQVGCVIVGPGNTQISEGWNGFPRGINDDVDCRHERPEKYLWTKHAEENAITNAARKGVSTMGATIYIPWFPCANCAGDIIQSGISTVVAYYPDAQDPVWGANMAQSQHMLEEAGVVVRFIPGSPPLSKVA